MASGSVGGSSYYRPASTKPSSSVSRPSSTGSYNASSGTSRPSGSTGSNVDYGILINNAMNAGASWQDVQSLVDQRVDKATSNANLNKYAYDNVYSNAMNYINQQKQQEAYQQSLIDSMNRYQDYMNQMNSTYDQVAQQQAAAQQAAVDQAVNSLTGQKTQIEQSYDDLYRQLYLDRRRAEKNLPQQLAAMGITGGLTESTALGLQTDYTDALRQGEQEKLSTLNSLDQAISDAQLTGSIESAQTAAQLALDRLNSYGTLVSQMQEQQNYANQLAYQMQQDQLAYNRQNMLDQLSRDDVSYDRKLQIAQYLYENTGDASGFRSLGLTDAQINALNNSYALAMQQYTAPVSSGGSGGSSGSVSTDNGGSNSYLPDTTLPVESIVSQIRNLIGRNRAEDALSVINQNWQRLTSAERNRIQSVLNEYGYTYKE